MRAPALVLFDVVETLVSLDPVRDALPGVGLAPQDLDLLFARLLRDAFALAATGTPRAFPDVARSALAVLAPGASEQDRDGVLQAFRELPAQPDALPALDLLHQAGVRVAALSNGSGATTRHVLERSGLADRLEAVLSVEDAGTWKPRAEVYRYAAGTLGAAVGSTALVAVHAWDVHGARHAGLRTGWCSRLEGSWGGAFDRAEVEGATLVEVVQALVSGSSRGAAGGQRR